MHVGDLMPFILAHFDENSRNLTLLYNRGGNHGLVKIYLRQRADGTVDTCKALNDGRKYASECQW